jgi:hypothetical protein
MSFTEAQGHAWALMSIKKSFIFPPSYTWKVPQGKKGKKIQGISKNR